MRSRDAGSLTFRRVMNPSPQQVYQDLLELEHDLGDYHKPIRFAKTMLIADTKANFQSETNPFTRRPWPKWEKKYKNYVEKRGQTKKLIRTWGPRPGAMHHAATSWSNWKVTNSTVQFAVERMPRNKDGRPYWVYHQQPTGRAFKGGKLNVKSADFQRRLNRHSKHIKATQGADLIRGIAASNPNWKAAQLKEELEGVIYRDAYAKTLGELEREHGVTFGEKDLKAKRKGQKLRPFIGPSKETQEKIREGFDGWANETVTFFYSKNKRNVFMRHL